MPTIAVDFDGVIHAYSKGWQDGTIYDPPLAGAIEALKKLQEKYSVFIFTARSPQDVAIWLRLRGVDAVIDPDHTRTFWHHKTRVLVTNFKLPAIAYIDDRAIKFTDWVSTLKELGFVNAVAKA